MVGTGIIVRVVLSRLTLGTEGNVNFSGCGKLTLPSVPNVNSFAAGRGGANGRTPRNGAKAGSPPDKLPGNLSGPSRVRALRRHVFACDSAPHVTNTLGICHAQLQNRRWEGGSFAPSAGWAHLRAASVKWGDAGRTPYLLFTLFVSRSPFGLTSRRGRRALQPPPLSRCRPPQKSDSCGASFM